ncbi:hypothetical protein HGM15179_003045 [Zosterops borbonicus]|uniref:Uncharacterized protein n=1 Tax=Zosterops borbonicus TaxID=364589 RepID=A0A8K1GTW7_9PASS|nr:hypothetical protein HGM15179_003045 [Zosterops borbonicus]
MLVSKFTMSQQCSLAAKKASSILDVSRRAQPAGGNRDDPSPLLSASDEKSPGLFEKQVRHISDSEDILETSASKAVFGINLPVLEKMPRKGKMVKDDLLDIERNVLFFSILRTWSEELVQNQEFQIGYYRSVLQTKFDVNRIWNKFDEIVKKGRWDADSLINSLWVVSIKPD